MQQIYYDSRGESVSIRNMTMWKGTWQCGKERKETGEYLYTGRRGENWTQVFQYRADHHTGEKALTGSEDTRSRDKTRALKSISIYIEMRR